MRQNIAVPIAIVVAALLVAGALFMSGRQAAPEPQGNVGGGEITIPAVSTNDHIIGNPDADVVIVEYSDIECPFCKQFHVTMQQIMAEYGEGGQVAWVYRHFPLKQLHPNAPVLAEASECVAELGGNTAFWSFLDEVFAIAPGNKRFPLDQLNGVVETVGVDTDAFNTCLESDRYQDLVQTHFNDARTAGGQGTPHNIVVLKDGTKVELAGAQPYATVKNVIDTILTHGAQQ